MVHFRWGYGVRRSPSSNELTKTRERVHIIFVSSGSLIRNNTVTSQKSGMPNVRVKALRHVHHPRIVFRVMDHRRRAIRPNIFHKRSARLWAMANEFVTGLMVERSTYHQFDRNIGPEPR